MQNSSFGQLGQLGQLSLSMGMHGSSYGTYDKLPPMALSPPPTHYGGHSSLSAMALTQQPSPLSPSSYSHNGLHSPSKSLSPTGYDYTVRGGSNGNGCLSGCPPHSPTLSPQSASLHSPPHGGIGTGFMSGGLSNINGLAALSPHAVSPHHNVSPTPPPMGIGLSGPITSREMLPSSPSPPTSVSTLTRDAMINSLSSSMSMNTMGLAGHSQSSHHLVGHQLANPHGHLHSQGHHGSIGGSGGGGSGGGTVASASSLGVGKNSPPSSVSTSSPSGNTSGGRGTGGPGVASSGGTGGSEIEEINTKELAARISAELKRYSIPQAIFAQRVLCRSQGTLSDLLRNPKPWSKLKSGRETFRRMWKWLQEPEFQRMSALRLAGKRYIFVQVAFCSVYCFMQRYVSISNVSLVWKNI